MTEMLLLTKETEGVACITLNRPEKRNAFDHALIDALILTLQKIKMEPSIRVVHLRGAGKVFCAGADLAWMQRMVDFSYEENRLDAEKLAELMYTLNALPQVTIAIIHGAAYGGGIGLAACCDLVVAEAQTQFCLSEVKLGIIPAVISPFVLARIGQKAMRRYTLTAEIFDASTAKNMGLVDSVGTMENIEADVQAWTKACLQNSPQAIRAMKVLLERMAGLNKFRENTVDAIAERRVSPDGQERLKAFLQQKSH